MGMATYFFETVTAASRAEPADFRPVPAYVALNQPPRSPRPAKGGGPKLQAAPRQRIRGG